MRILVCGSRDWVNAAAIHRELAARKPSLVITGDCRGADLLAANWAVAHHVPCSHFPAKWNVYGKRAGPMRNRQMLLTGKPDFVLAFHPDIEHSKGTRDMVNQTKQAGIPFAIFAC